MERATDIAVANDTYRIDTSLDLHPVESAEILFRPSSWGNTVGQTDVAGNQHRGLLSAPGRPSEQPQSSARVSPLEDRDTRSALVVLVVGFRLAPGLL